MKNLEKSLILAASLFILPGCPDSKEVQTQTAKTRDEASAVICWRHANNDAERCHARGLMGPKKCYEIREKAFKECMDRE